MHHPIVLFDGACSLCRREIAHYRRRAGASKVTWVDLSAFGPGQRVHGIAYDEAMAQFHVRDQQGNWQHGAAAFVELWHHLAAYRLIGSTVRRLRLTPLLDLAYRHFARWRLRRNCTTASCATAAGLHRDDARSTPARSGNLDKTGDTTCG